MVDSALSFSCMIVLVSSVHSSIAMVIHAIFICSQTLTLESRCTKGFYFMTLF
jgi:hypothetical protein